MAQIKYIINGISVSHFGPDQGNVIFLSPTKKTRKEDFRLLKNQLETNLSVDSIKTQKNGISLKLSDSVQEHMVGEYLRSLGASGGEQIEDAASVAQQSAEDTAKDQAQAMQPQMDPSMQMQDPMMGAQMGMQPPLNAGRSFGRYFNLLYESTFFKPNKVKKKGSARPGRRTGEYWKHLERVLGKNRQKIIENDVLVIRNKYNKKPKSEDRDEVLKSLDRAFNYFHKRIKEERGIGAAKKYANDYYSLDTLTPKSYSDDPPLEPADNFEPDKMGQMTGPLNGPDFSEFLKYLDNDESNSYDEIEVEEKTF